MRLATAALLALVVTGCVSIRSNASFGPHLSESILSRLVPGETGKGEVLALLGPPEEFLRHELVGALSDDSARTSEAVRLGNLAHDVFTWQFDRVEARGRWWGFYLWIHARVNSDILMVVFDENERVVERSFRRQTHE